MCHLRQVSRLAQWADNHYLLTTQVDPALRATGPFSRSETCNTVTLLRQVIKPADGSTCLAITTRLGSARQVCGAHPEAGQC